MKRFFLSLLIFLAAVLVIFLLWWLRPVTGVRPPLAPQPVTVTVLMAQPQDWRATVVSQGTVMPVREISLIAQVSGQVIGVSDQFAVGELSEANEVLVTLDDRDYQVALVNAQSQVANAEQVLALEKGQARQAKREWRDLGSDEANALSLRQPQVKAAEAALQAARAQRQQAELNVERTRIQAPFSGVVKSAQVDIGQYVPVGTVVGSVYDRSQVEVRLPLTDRQMALLGLIPDQSWADEDYRSVSLSATIAGQTIQWPAQLQRLEAFVDNTTRVFHGVASVSEPLDTARYSQPLLVGLFVKAEIAGRRFADVVVLPEKALWDEHVFVVVDNQLVRRPVTVIERRDQQVWVQGDISAGDAIVISDPRILRAGQSVVIGEAR